MRFGTSALWGKRLAGNADMGSAKIDELEKFKAITGGDTIDYEFKGKDRFSAKYTGLLIFCCNNLPKFGGDRGEHVYDRMITLPCNNVRKFRESSGFLAPTTLTEPHQNAEYGSVEI